MTLIEKRISALETEEKSRIVHTELYPGLARRIDRIIGDGPSSPLEDFLDELEDLIFIATPKWKGRTQYIDDIRVVCRRGIGQFNISEADFVEAIYPKEAGQSYISNRL